MKKWIKRYIVLILCIVLALGPILFVLKQNNVIKTSSQRIILWSVVGGVVLLFLASMTIWMIIGDKKNRGDKK